MTQAKPESITRRSALQTVAVAAAAAIPTVAVAAALPAGADPVFAAIERHRAAHATWEQLLDQERPLSEAIPHDRRKSSACRHCPEIVAGDDPRWIKYVVAESAASDEETHSGHALILTEPTTLEGLGAVLTYVQHFVGHEDELIGAEEYPDADDPDHRSAPWYYLFARTLARATAKMAT